MAVDNSNETWSQRLPVGCLPMTCHHLRACLCPLTSLTVPYTRDRTAMQLEWSMLEPDFCVLTPARPRQCQLLPTWLWLPYPGVV